MGIYAIPTSTTTKTSAWYNFFYELNKYFHAAKWKPVDYKLTSSDVALVFFDDTTINDFSTMPINIKKIAIVKTLNSSNLILIGQCSHVIYLNKYQYQAATIIGGLNNPSTVFPRHPMIDYGRASFNIERFLFIGGVMSPEKVVGLADRLVYFHELYPKDIEFLMFPNFNDNEEWNSNLKRELSKLESYEELKSRLFFVNGDVLNYNALKFRIHTAMHSAMWSNGMPIDEMKDLLHSKDEALLKNGINESSLYSLAASGQGSVIVDEESDYVTHFECGKTYTYSDFSDTLKDVLRVY